MIEITCYMCPKPYMFQGLISPERGVPSITSEEKGGVVQVTTYQVPKGYNFDKIELETYMIGKERDEIDCLACFGVDEDPYTPTSDLQADSLTLQKMLNELRKGFPDECPDPPELILDANITRIASWKAYDMARNNYISTTDSFYRGPGERLKYVPGWSICGECNYVITSETPLTKEEIFHKAISEWMDTSQSNCCRRKILNNKFTRMGVGICDASYTVYEPPVPGVPKVAKRYQRFYITVDFVDGDPKNAINLVVPKSTLPCTDECAKQIRWYQAYYEVKNVVLSTGKEITREEESRLKAEERQLLYKGYLTPSEKRRLEEIRQQLDDIMESRKNEEVGNFLHNHSKKVLLPYLIFDLPIIETCNLKSLTLWGEVSCGEGPRPYLAKVTFGGKGTIPDNNSLRYIWGDWSSNPGRKLKIPFDDTVPFPGEQILLFAEFQDYSGKCNPTIIGWCWFETHCFTSGIVKSVCLLDEKGNVAEERDSLPTEWTTETNLRYKIHYKGGDYLLKCSDYASYKAGDRCIIYKGGLSEKLDENGEIHLEPACHGPIFTNESKAESLRREEDLLLKEEHDLVMRELLGPPLTDVERGRLEDIKVRLDKIPSEMTEAEEGEWLSDSCVTYELSEDSDLVVPIAFWGEGA